jgi:hypothetical protein
MATSDDQLTSYANAKQSVSGDGEIWPRYEHVKRVDPSALLVKSFIIDENKFQILVEGIVALATTSVKTGAFFQSVAMVTQ